MHQKKTAKMILKLTFKSILSCAGTFPFEVCLAISDYKFLHEGASASNQSTCLDLKTADGAGQQNLLLVVEAFRQHERGLRVADVVLSKLKRY